MMAAAGVVVMMILLALSPLSGTWRRLGRSWGLLWKSPSPAAPGK
jgi:hypothetical protein